MEVDLKGWKLTPKWGVSRWWPVGVAEMQGRSPAVTLRGALKRTREGAPTYGDGGLGAIERSGLAYWLACSIRGGARFIVDIVAAIGRGTVAFRWHNASTAGTVWGRIRCGDRLSLRRPAPSPIAGVRRPPGPHPGHMLGAAEVVPVLGFGQPARLARRLARLAAGAGRAVPLVPHIARVRAEQHPAVQALASSSLRHRHRSSSRR